MFGAANSSMGYDMGRRSRPGTADWRWALQSAAVGARSFKGPAAQVGFGLLFVLVAVGFSIFQAPMWPEAGGDALRIDARGDRLHCDYHGRALSSGSGRPAGPLLSPVESSLTKQLGAA